MTEDLELSALTGLDDTGDDYVPGEHGPRSAPPEERPDWLALADDLVRGAQDETSATGKSRALFVAGVLRAEEGETAEALEHLRHAAMISPRLGLCTETFGKYAREAGASTYESLMPQIVQFWETVGRQAQSSVFKARAQRVLLAELPRLGRQEEAQALLDRLVRSGDGDLALELERIVTRLAQGKTLSGIVAPSGMATDVAVAVELLTGKASLDTARPSEELGELGSDLMMFRAAQHLKTGQVAQCIDTLERSGVQGEVVLQFAAALHGAAPGGMPERVRLLWKLARATSERRMWRSLILAALLASDRASIARALDQMDPTSGTLLLHERLFLAAFAGETSRVSEQERRELRDHDPITAMALGSLLAPISTPAAASNDALLVQLGASLSALHSSSVEDHVAKQTHQESLEIALDELAARDISPLLVSVLRWSTRRASQGNDHPGLEAAVGLFHHTRSKIADLFAAAYFFGTKKSLLARESFRQSAEAGDAALLLASIRGQLSLFWAGASLDEGGQSESESARWLLDTARLVGMKAPARERLATQLEVALLESQPDRRAQMMSEVLLAHVQDSEAAERDEWGAALFASALASAEVARHETALSTLRVLAEGESALARIARLLVVFLDSDAMNPREASLLAQSSDAGLRYLAAQRPSSDSDGADWERMTTLERQLAFARALVQKDLATSLVHLQSLGHLRQKDDSQPPDETLLALYLDIAEVEVSLLGDKANNVASTYYGQWSSSDQEESTRRFALERLAELDERKRDEKGALLFVQALAEEFPSDVVSQLRFEELSRTRGQNSPLASQRLSEILPPGDRDVYATVLGWSALVHSDLRMAKKHLEPLLKDAQPSLSVVRGLIIVAREKRDDALLKKCYELLVDNGHSELDRVAILFELALICTRQGDRAQAIDYLDQAVALRSDAFALLQLKNYLLRPEDPHDQKTQWETLASASSVPAHEAQLLRAAAEASERAGDLDGAVRCYQRLLDLDEADKSAYDGLVSILKIRDDSLALEQAYGRRLKQLDRGTVERKELVLALCEMLVASRHLTEAKARLEDSLVDHPDSIETLAAHARVSARLDDVPAMERSLVSLRSLLPAGPERTRVLLHLGQIYFERTEQMEKAMDAYQAVVAENPADEPSASRLVEIYCRLGLAERAAQLQTSLIQAASLLDAKRAMALRLADIYETVGRDVDKAAATLERTRKAWPLDAQVLSASIGFLDRHGDTAGRGITLIRVEKDARRKLEEGAIDHGLLDTLRAVAELQGRKAEAEACAAAHAAYLGQAEPVLIPAGLKCLSPVIDPDLAPLNYPDPLRRLLEKTGDAMDAAFSVDLNAIGARPLYDGALHDRVQKIAETIGWPRFELFVSDALGARCIPVGRRPPRLLIGAQIEQLHHRARDFLLLRAFKMQALGVGALSRSRPEDRYPALCALLMLFSPHYRPATVDPRKVNQARALIEQGLARVGYDDDVPTLALETIGSLGGGDETVMDAPRVLANRACLVGVGDLGALFEALAAGEGRTVAESGPSRFRFIDSHHEARELLLFMTTPAFSRARIRLGLAEPPETPAARSRMPTQTSIEPRPTGTLPSVPRHPRPPQKE